MWKTRNDCAVEGSKWLQQHDEAILEPELPIIDPHHHLGSRIAIILCTTLSFGRNVGDINCGHNVVATIVECGAMFKVGGDEHLRAVEEQNLLMVLLQCTSLLLWCY